MNLDLSKGLAELEAMRGRASELVDQIAKLNNSDLPIVEKSQKTQLLSDELLLLSEKTQEKARALEQIVPPDVRVKRLYALKWCSDRAKRALLFAAALSASQGETEIEPQTILETLANDSDALADILRNIGKYEPTKHLSSIETSESDASRMETSETVRHLIFQARSEIADEHELIDSEHLLRSLMRLHPQLVHNEEKVRAAVGNILGGEK